MYHGMTISDIEQALRREESGISPELYRALRALLASLTLKELKSPANLNARTLATERVPRDTYWKRIQEAAQVLVQAGLEHATYMTAHRTSTLWMGADGETTYRVYEGGTIL